MQSTITLTPPDRQKAIQEFIESFPTDISSHLTAKYPSTQYPKALHISKNYKLDTLIPRIGTRQATSEDRSVSRVCVCDTLLGCMSGYAAILPDFLNNGPDPEKNKPDGGIRFRGGWYIYSIPYEVAVKPDSTLVYDADSTGEYWLVNTSIEKEYHPHRIGKFFIEKTSLIYADKNKYIEHRIFLETKERIGAFADVIVDPGHYQIDFGYSREPDGSEDFHEFTITPIKHEDFDIKREICVSLLSHQEKHIW